MFGAKGAPILRQDLHYLQFDRKSFHSSLVTYEYHRLRPKGFLSLWYAWRKLCTYHAPTLTLSPNGPKRDSTCPTSPDIPPDPCHLRVPSGASKMISEPMVRLEPTMHLSYTDNNTVSKWTETRFHLTHLTLEYHQVRPKRFLSLWYVWRQPCTYLPPTLTLSPNVPKRDST